MISILPELASGKDSKSRSDSPKLEMPSRITAMFGDIDTFEGEVADPISLHKYLYANGDPVNGCDPSGHIDLVELGITTSMLAGLGAGLGIGINGINNYAIGKPFFNGAAGAAAFGAAGLPLAVAFPFVGIAL